MSRGSSLHWVAGALLTATVALAPVSAQAIPVSYDLSWTGSGGYSMTGSFSFDSASGPVIEDNEVTSLSINVLHNSVSQGTWSLADGDSDVFNFNFDAIAGAFIVGGFSADSAGQQWNAGSGAQCGAGQVGFASGSGAQGVCISGNFLGSIDISNPTLTATLASAAAPDPATFALMAIGLAGMGFARRSKSSAR